ncbi:MFS transporter [Chungangia koreensis]|uniref:MFS transporter n=1 Tax=Chungangia koreensis TaxID=752657 RepID=A0ABV8X980_9LACT
MMNSRLMIWKYPALLLTGIGIANIGAWIYLIALNLIILDMTESPLAVTVLYVLKPFASLLTNFWAGSLIDRLNQRNLMVLLDLFRAAFIACLPFFTSLWLIYSVVLIINMGSSIFGPTSMTYMTKLVPEEQRQRFNSLRSLIHSGAFVLGPAVAGLLFVVGSPLFALYINAMALLFSGLITLLLPSLNELRSEHSVKNKKLSLSTIQADWAIVLKFSKGSLFVVSVYSLFSTIMLLTGSVDSLEASFAKVVLSLSNDEYGFLVSIAGAGFVIGSVINTLFSTFLKVPFLLSFGTLFLSAGYIIYSLSHSFTLAAIGFFTLSFALSFANTGFYTFYQNHIPVEIMGRVSSVFGLFEAILAIVATVLFGVFAELLSIKTVVIFGTLLMFLISLLLCSVLPSEKRTNIVPTRENT